MSSPSSPATVKLDMSETPDPTKWPCPKCHKTSYESEFRAWQAIGKILRVGGSDVVPCRVYECPHGEGFHLTSKDEWKE